MNNIYFLAKSRFQHHFQRSVRTFFVSMLIYCFIRSLPDHQVLNYDRADDNVVYIPCEFCDSLVEFSSWSAHTVRV